jgi:DNA-binding CsgD family transcriptional regulator
MSRPSPRGDGWLSAADQRAVLSIIRLAYEGIRDFGAWPQMLAKLRDLFRARDACLVRTPLGQPASPLFIFENIDPDLAKVYRESWSAPPRNPVVTAALQRGWGRVFMSDEIVPWQQLERTEFYEVFRRPRGVRWEMGMTALRDNDSRRFVTVNRSRTQPRYGKREQAIAEILGPHVVEALRQHALLELERRHVASLGLALESVSDAVLMIEKDGGLHPLNAVAERLLAAERLEAHRPVASQQPRSPLAALVSEVARFERLLAGDLAVSSRSASLRRVVLLASGRYRVDGTVRFEDGLVVAAILVVREAPTEVDLDAATSATRWSLSRREVSVLRGVVQGQGTPELCRDLGITPETLKTHLRHLFEKVGVRNRPELIVTVLRGAGTV